MVVSLKTAYNIEANINWREILMAKTIKRVKHDSIDLRKRSGIVVESVDIDKMSRQELIIRINQLNADINQNRKDGNDFDFMIISPKRKALQRMKVLLREKLAMKW